MEEQKSEMLFEDFEPFQQPKPKEKLYVEESEYKALKSYFMKALRLGDAKGSILAGEWLHRAKGSYEVLRLLANSLGEESDPNEWARLMPVIHSLSYKASKGGGGLQYHDLWLSVFVVAKSKKWFQSPEGCELEEARQIVKEKKLPKVEFPPWTFDRHTTEGWRRIRGESDQKPDLRMDGAWDARWQKQSRWEKVKAEMLAKNPDATYEEIVKEWVRVHYEEPADLEDSYK